MQPIYNNNRLQQLDTLDEARKLWKESEWRLNCLRTQTGTTQTAITDQQLLEWMQQCQNQQ